MRNIQFGASMEKAKAYSIVRGIGNGSVTIVLAGIICGILISPNYSMNIKTARAEWVMCVDPDNNNAPVNDGGECAVGDGQGTEGICQNGVCIPSNVEPAPEMPVVLVPLFLIIAGAVIARMRRQAFAAG